MLGIVLDFIYSIVLYSTEERLYIQQESRTAEAQTPGNKKGALILQVKKKPQKR